jgi:cyclic pyranopterin phosphate synthase
VSSDKLTHLDDEGRAKMVDVGGKPEVERVAVAAGTVVVAPATLAAIREGRVPKGDVGSVVRLAGVMAAKKTPELIPLCHAVRLTSVDVEMTLVDGDDAGPDRVELRATARAVDRTGVEMEALTAISVAGLALYDMVKAIDKNCRITDIRLIEKRKG